MARQYCEYYQGILRRDKIWFVTGCLRNQDNVAFDRALEKKNNLFEFFVPTGYESDFLALMEFFSRKGYLISLEKKPNRIQEINGD